MTKRQSRACAHPPLDSFIAFKGKQGARVWRCSHCGKEDVWRDGWTYYGAVECLNCSQTEVLAVVCSDACRDAFKPSDPALRLELVEHSQAGEHR